MRLFLSEQCEGLTGSLGSGYGYAVQKQRGGYYGKRNSKGVVPPNGHLRFILKCAELARMKLHIVDIRVPRIELQVALMEAGEYPASLRIAQTELNAEQVFNLKQQYKL